MIKSCFLSYELDLLFILQTLLLVCLIPFVTGIDIVFADHLEGKNAALSIRAVAVVVFLVGVSQLLFWAVAWLRQ